MRDFLRVLFIVWEDTMSRNRENNDNTAILKRMICGISFYYNRLVNILSNIFHARKMSKNKTSLVCRMMSSAACAYNIDTRTTQFTPSQPYYEAVEYKTLPVPVSGGSDNINAVLVGTTSDGVVAACRGTLPPATDLPSMLDWIQDVFFSMPKSVNGLPGKVHSGFYMAVNSVWEPLLKEVSRQLDAAGPETDLYITGHSKGGGMASILAMLLNNESGLLNLHKPPQVFTFASPKPGDTDFAQVYNAKITQESYENYLDLVPFLPPSDSTIQFFAKIPFLGELFKKAEDWNYSPVGKRCYIEKNGSVVPATSPLDDFRIGEIAFKFVQDDLQTVVDAHCHLCKSTDCAGGYMRGACQGDVCNK
jgi:triacylglycerol lipase